MDVLSLPCDNGFPWENTNQELPGRTPFECQLEWLHNLHPLVKMVGWWGQRLRYAVGLTYMFKAWSLAEDTQLVKLVTAAQAAETMLDWDAIALSLQEWMCTHSAQPAVEDSPVPVPKRTGVVVRVVFSS